MKILFIILTLLIPTVSWAQMLPLPIKYYPLDNVNIEDAMSGRISKSIGTVSAFTDRFGKENQAVFLDAKSYFEIPMQFDDLDAKAITITYWLYVDNVDSIAQYFSAIGANKENLFGMLRCKDRAVLNMYHYTSESMMSFDNQWMWEDSNFKKVKGWYQVSIIYNEGETNFYLISPDGNMTKCFSTFIADWKLVQYLKIGGEIPIVIDDFKIYSHSLSKEDIKMLHQDEANVHPTSNQFFNKEAQQLFYDNSFTDNLADNCLWNIYLADVNEGRHDYYIQNKATLKFLESDNHGNLKQELPIGAEGQLWSISHVADDGLGKIYEITNLKSTLNLALSQNAVTQKVFGYQWYLTMLKGDSLDVNRKNINDFVDKVRWDDDAKELILNLFFDDKENVSVSVFSTTGKMLHSCYFNEVYHICKRIPLDVQLGIYMVRLSSSTLNLCVKFIVK